MLRRTINGSSTTMRVYAFGLEEHKYGSAGANLDNTYYYSLGGRLLGALNSGTTFYLTDALGSVLASFNNPAGSAVVKGNQVFGPYGTARDVQGTINTAKGFTGQYNDSLSGLDYYNARYYDPVVGEIHSGTRWCPIILQRSPAQGVPSPTQVVHLLLLPERIPSQTGSRPVERLARVEISGPNSPSTCPLGDRSGRPVAGVSNADLVAGQMMVGNLGVQRPHE